MFDKSATLFVLVIGVASVLGEENIYSFEGKDIDGNDVSYSSFEGKPMLLVNVGSKCGFTAKNYPALVKLCEEYEPKGLVCIFYPSGDFMNQEYDTNEEIKTKTLAKYNVKNLVMSKDHVKGEEAQPVYAWINSQVGEPAWNYAKVTIDKEGKVVQSYPPTVDPENLKEDIEQLL